MLIEAVSLSLVLSQRGREGFLKARDSPSNHFKIHRTNYSCIKTKQKTKPKKKKKGRERGKGSGRQ